MTAWVRCCLFSTAKRCISHCLSSHFPCMPRRSRMAWKIARHLCYMQGSKCPLIGMIRLSLDVFRKNKPFALLIRCCPLWKTQAPGNSYGSKSFQTGPGHSQIFKALLKIRFHSSVSLSIQLSFSTAPHPRYFSLDWSASQHCFRSTPLTRLVIYYTSAFRKPQPGLSPSCFA